MRNTYRILNLILFLSLTFTTWHSFLGNFDVTVCVGKNGYYPPPSFFHTLTQEFQEKVEKEFNGFTPPLEKRLQRYKNYTFASFALFSLLIISIIAQHKLKNATEQSPAGDDLKAAPEE